MKKLQIVLILVLTFVACNSDKPTAQDIIDKAIAISGGDAYTSFEMTFDFRDKHYRIKRDNGIFEYERQFQDSIGDVKDIVSNSGFERYVNDQLIEVPDSMAVKYTSSVNSVQYFALLPFGLNDAAVQKTYLGRVSIKGADYHKIKITFREEGGGEDFEDVFIYWIGTNNHKVDYLAYSYNESDGIGLRFREALNERYINGIRCVDYNNYKPEINTVNLSQLDELFENDQLILLSKIENENISVVLN